MAHPDRVKKNKNKENREQNDSVKLHNGSLKSIKMSKPEQEKLHEGQVALESRKKKKIKKERPAAMDDNVDEEDTKDVPLRGMKKKIKKKRPAAVDDNVDEENKKDVPLRGMKKKIKKKRSAAVDDNVDEENKKDVLLRGMKKKIKKKRPAAVDDNVDEENKKDVPLRGMKKWLLDYHSKRPGLKVLQQEIDVFIVDHEAQAEKERKEREAAAAAEGWTVVVHQKGRKKTVDSESGIAVGSVGLAAAQAKNAKKKAKESAVTFYRFQRREARRNEILELQNKFEEDKKRIAQMRAARKFRPY